MAKRVLVEAGRAVPADAGRVRVRGFRNGQQIELKRGDSFNSADVNARQYWPAGTTGELLGQDGKQFVVLFEGERFCVEPKDVCPADDQQSREEQK